MFSIKEKVDTFFNDYADRFNTALKGGDTDIDKVAQCFTEAFLEASPLGVNCGKNNDQFKESIPKGYEFYKRIGIKSMDILSKDLTSLDPYHIMVKVRWETAFQRKDNSEGRVEFDVIYLLQTIMDDLKIFAYITGDEQAVLKQEGLI